MNCYNSEAYLHESIKSVLKQTYQNWELIFWDNKSKDSSASIFKSFKDKRLKYYLAKKHTTLGEARNKALEKVTGEYIAFLDCDDLWLERKLEKQIQLFKDKVGIVICDTLFFNEYGIIKQLYKKKKPPTGKVFHQLLDSYFISLETVVVRTCYVKKLKYLFDPNFQVIEEYDFFIRLSHYCELDYVDEVLAKWRVHPQSLTWKKPELFPIELKLFLKKMQLEFKNFNEKYKNEIQKINQKINFQDALCCWSKGDKIKARKIILKNISLRNITLFLMTFLPFSFFHYLYKLKNGL